MRANLSNECCICIRTPANENRGDSKAEPASTVKALEKNNYRAWEKAPENKSESNAAFGIGFGKPGQHLEGERPFTTHSMELDDKSEMGAAVGERGHQIKACIESDESPAGARQTATIPKRNAPKQNRPWVEKNHEDNKKSIHSGLQAHAPRFYWQLTKFDSCVGGCTSGTSAEES